jgi:uncharacterized repeat protein (TIGR03803 family)
MQAYNQPIGIIEGSLGTFYSFAGGGGQSIFSVTSKGTITYLAQFSSPPDVVTSLVVSGADGRYYSSLGYSNGSSSSNVISVSQNAGSLKTYAANTFDPSFSQNLPDGSLLGYVGSRLLKSNLRGGVSLVYQFPVYNIEPPIYATDRSYYGVAVLSDASGYVYKLTPTGSFTQLHTFPAQSFVTNSANVPFLEGTDGNLYGTTPDGGTYGYGTIYKLTHSGQYTLLYTFPKSPAGSPSGLIEASDGKLYGGTVGSGNSLLFSITKSGQYEVVYKMSDQSTDGQCPCFFVQGSDGQIYGVTQLGGPIGAGVVFALDAGLPKPKPRALEFEPESAPVGTPIRIWGYNLLSASVQFNGVPATTVHNSGSNYVWATVPAGATTGPITVTTPGGTSTTHDSFTVQ